MLKLKPNCEWCDIDLPANATNAMICTYECTFCDTCVSSVLENVCPNCGGGFCSRPIRPVVAHREGVSLQHQPASVERVTSDYSRQQLRKFTGLLKNINPQDR